MVYLKCLDKFKESVPHTKTRKKLISIYVCKHFIFEVQRNSALT